MGDASVSTYQQAGRVGHLERRFGLPLTTAIRSDVTTVPPDVTLDDLVWDHMLRTRHTTVCVVAGTEYVGIVTVDDLHRIERDRWSEVTVGSITHDDAPRALPGWRLEQTLDAMTAADLEMLPVVTDGTTFVGVVTLNDIVRLDEILRRTD